MSKYEEEYMRVAPEFLKLVREFSKKFGEKYGLNPISDLQVTRIITKKIEKIGGLIP